MEKLPSYSDEEIQAWRDAYKQSARLSDTSPATWNGLEAALKVRSLDQVEELREALWDVIEGFKYIEQRYGRLDGVGWDRVYSYEALLKDSTSGGEGV